MTRKECSGFTVLPQIVFYAIPFPSWREFFDETRSNEVMKEVQFSYGVHVWNKLSSQMKITVGSKQAYGLLAQTHCPRVYSNCGPTF
jgi:lactosylceramide 4-alpha-galactosyltransferase